MKLYPPRGGAAFLKTALALLTAVALGGLVALLCSDDARWLTGQRLEATGGYNI